MKKVRILKRGIGTEINPYIAGIAIGGPAHLIVLVLDRIYQVEGEVFSLYREELRLECTAFDIDNYTFESGVAELVREHHMDEANHVLEPLAPLLARYLSKG